VDDVDRIASVAAHDLAEPLRTVQGFALLLAERYEGQLDPTADVYLRQILDGTRRMHRLVDGLGAFARAGRGPASVARVDMDAVLRDVVRSLDTAIDEAQATVLVDDLPPVTGDRGQLEQLFQNLLLNTLHHSGGRPAHVEVGVEARAADATTFTVADRGPGVPADARERIFELLEGEGTGLGLAICARVAESHGGRIWVEPRADGPGSIFRVTLPGTGRAGP
jgi:signal transduction histidine kinase